MEEIIVILSNPKDTTAQRVVQALQQREACALFLDTGSFPSRIRLDATFVDTRWQGAFWYDGACYDLAGIKSVLVRRPTHYQVDQKAPELIQAFLENEALKGFGGILRSLKQALWMNPLDAHRAANFKPVQLQAASYIGLRVPHSLITNDPDAVRRFFQEHAGQIIYKTLHGGNTAGGGMITHTIFTSRVLAAHLEQVERVRLTAHYFQISVEKYLELRITVVGNHALAVAIHSQECETTKVDWRASYPDLRYSPYPLPAPVAQQCIELTHSLGLSYSAIDMIVTPESEYIFLELNPGGQYEWLEHETHIPISATIADVLLQGKRGETR